MIGGIENRWASRRVDFSVVTEFRGRPSSRGPILIRIPRSSSSLSSYSYLALGIPTLDLLVILYIGTLLPK
jgi:hypothetical protein